MQLLDAILAFTLTLAALATVVTVIMEAAVRIARVRKKNMVEEMRLLNKELGKGPLNMSDDERWDFFVRVVENPAAAAIGELKPLWQNLDLEARLDLFGRGKSVDAGFLRRIGACVAQLFHDKKRAGLYEEVSLEYLLRCLAETEAVQKVSLAAGRALKVEFNRIARKYEEIGSSVSANFKRHAQLWSIWIGIALAVVANIDGVRIFEAYRVDPNLATAVIAQQETFSRKDPAARAEAARETPVTLDQIQQTALRARQQVADLVALGIPLGWRLYPACPYGGTTDQWGASSPRCKQIGTAERGLPPLWGWKGFRVLRTARIDPGGFLLWLFKVVVTGILIGLGAPFWFDIAKRLAQLRKGLQKATASTEYRLSARNANGDYEKRKEIVENVLADAAGEEDVKLSRQPRGRPLLAPDGKVYTEG